MTCVLCWIIGHRWVEGKGTIQKPIVAQFTHCTRCGEPSVFHRDDVIADYDKAVARAYQMEAGDFKWAGMQYSAEERTSRRDVPTIMEGTTDAQDDQRQATAAFC